MAARGAGEDTKENKHVIWIDPSVYTNDENVEMVKTFREKQTDIYLHTFENVDAAIEWIKSSDMKKEKSLIKFICCFHDKNETDDAKKNIPNRLVEILKTYKVTKTPILIYCNYMIESATKWVIANRSIDFPMKATRVPYHCQHYMKHFETLDSSWSS